MPDIPSYNKKYLFIDDAWVVKAQGVRRTTNAAVKHPEPVIEMDRPWDKPGDELSGANVIYDDDEGCFKMWYGVSTRVVDWGAATRKEAYATSADGLHWERPILNLVDHKGPGGSVSKANNYYLDGEMEEFTSAVLIDPHDAPLRRFKMICVCNSTYDSGKVTDWVRHHVPLNLATSEDGLHWDRPAFVNPVVRGVSDGPFSFFYDRDRHVFQLFTRRVPNLPRDISLYESRDLVNWEDCGRIFVAGDELDPPTLYNIHQAAVLQYEGYRLALLNTMHHHPLSEELGVFQAPPDDYPGADRIGMIDLQLGYSTDGRTWHRAHDRAPVVPVGPPGALDAGMMFPTHNPPAVRDGDTYIYVSCFPYGHTAWAQERVFKTNRRDLRKSSHLMLAIMPEDHWVSFDAGAEAGMLLAGPWRQRPHRLYVNADAAGGSIEVEIVDAYERPLPGLGRSDAIAITADGKGQEVRWKGDVHPDEVEGDYRGGVMARFHMKNAKLYSCTLSNPDPDGGLRRYWGNLDWNRNLFHRRDQWDGASHMLAPGLPPVTRGMPNY
ncbi:MAG: hypothetical protein CMJ18_09230 [Phycisphaeraceae bacterium]|nr:hypothetical protein [Phycisphaeraceae bacterium]